MVVPNRKIVGEVLHNYGNIRQVDVTVGVAYDTDVNQALALIQEVLNSNPRVLSDLAPIMGVSLLADSSVNISIKPWAAVEDYGAVGCEINKAVLETFRTRGISIPLPQREIRMLGVTT